MNGTDKYKTYEWSYHQNDFKFCPRCGSHFNIEDLHISNQPQLVCDNCKFIFYLDPKIVVAAVVVKSDQVLLLKRAENPGKGKWGLPGGYVSRGESVTEAVINEVSEEAGISFISKGILEFSDLPNSQGLQIIFWGQTEHSTPKNNIESSEAHFFQFNDIPWDDLAFETTSIALKSYINLITEGK